MNRADTSKYASLCRNHFHGNVMKFIIEGSACILEGNAVIAPVVAFWSQQAKYNNDNKKSGHDNDRLLMFVKQYEIQALTFPNGGVHTDFTGHATDKNRLNAIGR